MWWVVIGHITWTLVPDVPFYLVLFAKKNQKLVNKLSYIPPKTGGLAFCAYLSPHISHFLSALLIHIELLWCVSSLFEFVPHYFFLKNILLVCEYTSLSTQTCFTWWWRYCAWSLSLKLAKKNPQQQKKKKKERKQTQELLATLLVTQGRALIRPGHFNYSKNV